MAQRRRSNGNKPDLMTSLVAIVASAVSGFVAVLTANSGEEERISKTAKTAVTEVIEYKVGELGTKVADVQALATKNDREFIQFKTQLAGDLTRFADNSERDSRSAETRFTEVKAQLTRDVERLREDCERTCASGRK